MDLVIPSWKDVRPEDDNERFTQRSDERRQLFEQARDLGRRIDLPPVSWAFFQIANLEKIREIVQSESLWKCFADEDSWFEPKTVDVVRLWQQKSAATTMTASNATSPTSSRFTPFNQVPSSPLRTMSPQTSTSRTRSKRKHGSRESSPARSPDVAARCKKRDGNLCVVSRMGATDAAHVYPWCAFGGENGERVKDFWKVLGMFWPSKLVEAWRGKIFVDPNENKGTETVENMLTLTSTLHRFHTKGVFALRPVQMSEDKTQLELEFHWLVLEERESSKRVNLFVEPKPSYDRRSSGKGYGPFFRINPTNDHDSVLLVSGTRFALSTDDPKERPLPDPGLLELQWHLQRVLAMSGAAGWKEEEFDNDDDDDGPGVGIRDKIEDSLDNDLPEDRRRSRDSPGSDSDDSADGWF
ncbi:hypothetical protein ACJQWK_08628 [Exserohilum turcicum]|uniref:HNH nuclease domain-containing protein n=1 Tax=Exserohilum turcicum (strain 28A) TaxID=671987 RepID=R0KEA7_EXST2|nr:uncharacterized protein SETTUDRAFT_153314 [Exserohilum turcica Et28A]EOA86497.1 hypothetical protein SETTUDRAFT_153314 [Exserohilum turcica Et28A]